MVGLHLRLESVLKQQHLLKGSSTEDSLPIVQAIVILQLSKWLKYRQVYTWNLYTTYVKGLGQVPGKKYIEFPAVH